MAVEIKELGPSGTKWVSRAGGAATEMATNAAANAEKWARETQAAASNFRAAISAANIEARFRRGVQKAGAEKFRRKVTAVAQNRFTEGVAAGEADWESGFQPYHATISGVTLGPRRPRGDAGNYTRVKQIGDALNAKRLALLAAS